MFWPRGKVLGGSSILNYMVYARGNKLDFDQWDALGNTGWSFQDVLPYFKKSEDNHNDLIAQDVEYHSQGGPLTVESIPFKTKLADAFVQTLKDEGYPIRDDINGANQTGVTLIQATIRNGARCSTNKAFLQSAESRENLIILKNSFVTKILFNEKKQAYAVLFEDHLGNQSRRAIALREIILSAGAINTPQLLMLSGIGPREQLESLGIEIIADLPGVGENLQDHVGTFALSWTINQSLSIMPDRLTKEDFYEFQHNGAGILTSPGAGVESIAFINTKYADVNGNWPDIELIFLSSSPVSDKLQSSPRVLGFNNDIWEKYYLPNNEKDTFSIVPILLRPKSIGNIRLRSKDPKVHPIINPNYFSDPYDLAVLADAMRKVFEIGNSAEFQKYGAQLFEGASPGCENFTLYSDEYWKCLISHQTMTIFHCSGTAKMGSGDDPMAVVDSQLRVYKVSGLRIADASVMPKVTSGHTNAPAIMIGENAADIIKASWSATFG